MSITVLNNELSNYKQIFDTKSSACLTIIYVITEVICLSSSILAN